MRTSFKIESLGVLILLFCLIIYTGCNKSENAPSNTGKQGTPFVEDVAPLALYYPLTAERLNNILNGNESLGLLYIYYCARTKPNPDSLADVLVLGLDTGVYLEDNSYTQLSSYRGKLVQIISSADPQEEYSFESDFTLNDIQAIFDYMIQNSDYFFNAEEYNGEQSWSDEYICIGGEVSVKNYCFCMSIDTPGNPGTYPIPAWAISKCVDEYPEPYHPLYGLFQLLENDFISQFE